MNEIIETEEEYFYKIFNTISESVITDEYFDKNALLLSSISSSLFDINSITDGALPPDLGRRIIEEVFSNIFKHGIR
jgi:hypothetical protein